MATAQNTLDVIIPVGSVRELNKVNVRLGAVSFIVDQKKICIGNGYSVDFVAGVTGYGELDFKPKINGKEINGNNDGKYYGLIDNSRIVNEIPDKLGYFWDLIEEDIASGLDEDKSTTGYYYATDTEKVYKDLVEVKLLGKGNPIEATIDTIGKNYLFIYQIDNIDHYTISIGSKGATEDDIPSAEAVRKELDKKQNKIDIWEQETASTMWDILHYQKCYPNIRCVDDSGNEMVGEVIYVNEDEIRVKFSNAESGRAYLS